MRILISEDNENEAKLIEHFLKPIARTITKAYTMSEVLRIVRLQQFDVVTFDLSYPDSVRDESIGRIKEIKELQPHCIIIVVTGFYQPEMERLLIEAGADGIIKKTMESNTPNGFLHAVKDIVDQIINLPSHLKQIATLEKMTQRLADYYKENPEDKEPSRSSFSERHSWALRMSN